MNGSVLAVVAFVAIGIMPLIISLKLNRNNED